MTFGSFNQIIIGSYDQRIATCVVLSSVIVFYLIVSGRNQWLVLWLHTKQVGMGRSLSTPPQITCLSREGVFLNNFITFTSHKMQEFSPADHEASKGLKLLLIMAKHVKDRKLLYPRFVFQVYSQNHRLYSLELGIACVESIESSDLLQDVIVSHVFQSKATCIVNFFSSCLLKRRAFREPPK